MYRKKEGLTHKANACGFFCVYKSQTSLFINDTGGLVISEKIGIVDVNFPIFLLPVVCSTTRQVTIPPSVLKL